MHVGRIFRVWLFQAISATHYRIVWVWGGIVARSSSLLSWYDAFSIDISFGLHHGVHPCNLWDRGSRWDTWHEHWNGFECKRCSGNLKGKVKLDKQMSEVQVFIYSCHAAFLCLYTQNILSATIPLPSLGFPKCEDTCSPCHVSCSNGTTCMVNYDWRWHAVWPSQPMYHKSGLGSCRIVFYGLYHRY